MSALESQVRVTVRGTAGSEARWRFLQGMPRLSFFLQTLARFAFEPVAWAGPLAPCASGESTRSNAHAKAAVAAIRNVKPVLRTRITGETYGPNPCRTSVRTPAPRQYFSTWHRGRLRQIAGSRVRQWR